MKLNTKLNKERIKNHFAYGVWKYLLAAALIICGWSLIYTTSAYRSPNYLKVDIYVSTTTATEEVTDAYGEEARQAILPNLEEVNFILLSTGEDDAYFDAQVMVYVYANEGDIYMLGRDKLKSLAATGAFMDLTPAIESGALNVDGLDLTYGYIENQETQETALYAIPADKLPGFAEKLGIRNTGMMLAVTAYSANPDDAIAMLNYMIQDFKEAE